MTRQVVNRNGVVILGFDGEEPETLATRMTQVFRTGEIWGLNKELIEPLQPEPGRRSVIPWPATSQVFEHALQNYLDFARQTLKLELPVIVIAGLAMVNEALLIPPKRWYQESRPMRCVENFIGKRWAVDSFDVAPSQVFTDFYAGIWDSCGLDYASMATK